MVSPAVPAAHRFESQLRIRKLAAALAEICSSADPLLGKECEPAIEVSFPAPDLLKGWGWGRQLTESVSVVERLNRLAIGVDMAKSGFLLKDLIESIALRLCREILNDVVLCRI